MREMLTATIAAIGLAALYPAPLLATPQAAHAHQRAARPAAHLALSAQTEPGKGAAPAWVERGVTPAPDPAHRDAPAQLLLIDGQTLFTPHAMTTYIEMAVIPQTIAGLQDAGTIAWPWDAIHTRITFNRLEIHRGGATIDLLKDAKFRVIERETSLEHSRFDGLRTVVLPAPGLQVGDVLTVALTYQAIPGAAVGADESISNWYIKTNVVLASARYIVPEGSHMRWRTGAVAAKPVITKTALGTEYRFRRAEVVGAEFPTATRAHDQLTDVQFSDFGSWAEVAELMAPLYRAARISAPQSPLTTEADKIAATTADPARRMLAALRLTQEQVRYVALLLGEGAYSPAPADQTWAAKYGDCKAKSAMLLALLDRLHIKAEPMLARSTAGDILVERLPSLDSFDHVIVRAEIGGTPYFLDATDYGQRTLNEVRGSTLYYALPMVSGAKLEKLPRVPMTEPGIETNLVWDGRQGVTGDVPFNGTMTLRGTNAAIARAKLATLETTEKFDDYLKGLIPEISNDALTLVSKQDDENSGNFVVAYKGAKSLDWQTYSDLKGYRFSFDNSAAKWDPKFDRDKGPFMDLPVQLNDDFWQREVETLIVPDPRGFTIDAKPVDRLILGAAIKRNVTIDGNRISSDTSFRHTLESVTAAQAREAIPLLKEVRDQWADVVAPRSFKLPRENSSKK